MHHQSHSSSKHGSTVLFHKLKAVFHTHCVSRETTWETCSKHKGGAHPHTTKTHSVWLQEISCIHQKLKHTLNASLVYCESILSTACPWVNKRVWAGLRGHDDQQLAQRGWSQQAVLLWHSWGESVPSTWLVPWRELADGTDAGVCKEGGPCRWGQEAEPNRGRVWGGGGLEWTGLERGHDVPQADRCFSSLGSAYFAEVNYLFL